MDQIITSKVPLLITVEGTDGSGKSIQAELLVQRLTQLGRKVIKVASPGATATGGVLRSLLLRTMPDSEGIKTHPLTELLLFAADRAQLYAEVVVPALEAGTDVVCDRGIGSTYAYQMFGSLIPAGEVRASVELSLKPWLPFLSSDNVMAATVVCDLPLALCKQRLSGKKADYWESQPDSFREQVQAGYRNLRKLLRQPVIEVDASMAVEQVAAKIWTELCTLANAAH